MLTISLKKSKNSPLYHQLYNYIKNAILHKELMAGTRLPSKRALAQQLGISTITIEGAYGQLLAEGYIYAKPKSGYYVSTLDSNEVNMNYEKIAASPERLLAMSINNEPTCEEKTISPSSDSEGNLLNLSSNRILTEAFPFSIWSKLLRNNLSLRQKELMEISPAAGIYELRMAICKHLFRFRGMNISPQQIIIGAGTEYLYELLIKLLGRQKIYCVEDPGYNKLQSIYTDNEARCISLPIDEYGMSIEVLNRTACDVIHISPSHHFPTGIITPVSRRYELLSWANSGQRYIIEDDYDSEFRLSGKPIPSLFSIDIGNKVIYMNTFSKSLSPTIRISYMILPLPLMERFNKQFNYLNSTVPTFEQYTLADFISKGYFERHINRMRNHYKKIRLQLQTALGEAAFKEAIRILPQASGLYFLLRLKTRLSDEEIQQTLRERGISLRSLQTYYQNKQCAPEHIFVVNYSGLSSTDIPFIISSLQAVLSL